MIYVGIDDTDNLDSQGTNQLARKLVARVKGRFDCRLVVRHQLLFDPRVPYTSKNSSAALLFESADAADIDELADEMRNGLLEFSAEGSDPGLCVIAESVPAEVIQFGHRCQQDVVRQQDARELAAELGIFLEGLGGTNDGVIGALCAVGLAFEGNDGRIVHIGPWPDDLENEQPIETLHERGVEVREVETGAVISSGVVNVGKHLRPNYRERRIVQFVERDETSKIWNAVRLL
ncbi:MAG: ABC transporter substrate-binding protein [Planctomycetaceae bacterium]|nr:ABC transporter substrate-binding protein [Planctomycetaceae bacterium]MBT6153892.1 ABC transporter substrate-binding protein [Planctomycetaceae bacterium]MBT6486637.1 ABC transporter substrate-binding protein [Planctomycetaceae bacterium]MBT6494294.1 ABC transporter substrate-binding protein [Planctomycetaceae bacterium]